MPKTEPRPIEWDEVALVGFCNNRPVTIMTAEPKGLFEWMAELVKNDLEMEADADWDWDDEITVRDVINRIEGVQWKLYHTEDAKEVFCSRHEKDEPEQHPSNKPLPGQLTLPIGE